MNRALKILLRAAGFTVLLITSQFSAPGTVFAGAIDTIRANQTIRIA